VLEFVTSLAKSDQVFFRIVSRPTAELFVVNLKLLNGSTTLTPPPVSLDYPSAQLSVAVQI
jgi:hypothetical protein